MLVSIGKAAKLIGVSISTLRRWDSSQSLSPQSRTLGGHRRYNLEFLKEKFLGVSKADRINVGYSRVSSSDQKQDLERQSEALSQYLSGYSTKFEIIKDLGSGLKTDKPGLRKLLRLILAGKVAQLVITYQDRLLRFGSNLIFEVCKFMGTEVNILNDKPDQSFEEELSCDVITIMTVACARLYGKRSHQNRKSLAA